MPDAPPGHWVTVRLPLPQALCVQVFACLHGIVSPARFLLRQGMNCTAIAQAPYPTSPEQKDSNAWRSCVHGALCCIPYQGVGQFWKSILSI